MSDDEWVEEEVLFLLDSAQFNVSQLLQEEGIKIKAAAENPMQAKAPHLGDDRLEVHVTQLVGTAMIFDCDGEKCELLGTTGNTLRVVPAAVPDAPLSTDDAQSLLNRENADFVIAGAQTQQQQQRVRQPARQQAASTPSRSGLRSDRDQTPRKVSAKRPRSSLA
ncbi:MAG: hypothetical protein MHM6MM_005181 [Cercozoa sp. M6MM]